MKQVPIKCKNKTKRSCERLTKDTILKTESFSEHSFKHIQLTFSICYHRGRTACKRIDVVQHSQEQYLFDTLQSPDSHHARYELQYTGAQEACFICTHWKGNLCHWSSAYLVVAENQILEEGICLFLLWSELKLVNTSLKIAQLFTDTLNGNGYSDGMSMVYIIREISNYVSQFN